MRSLTAELSPSSADADVETGRGPLLISGHLDAWWCFTAVAVAGMLVVVTATAFLLRHPWRSPLVAVTVLSIVAAVCVYAWQLGRRQWLTWSTDSLHLGGWLKSRELLDSDVTRLAVTSEPRHAVGRVVADNHRLWLWLGDQTRPLTLETRGTAGEEAPWTELVQRLQERLERAALNQLKAGGRFIRRSWSWIDGRVVSVDRGRTLDIPVAGMTAVDEDGGELRIWTATDPAPALRLAKSGQDVWLLGRLLRSAVGAPGDDGVVPAVGLGRILHESRPRAAAMTATALCGLSTSVALFAIAGAAVLRLPPLAIVGAGTGMAAVMLWSMSRRLWQCTFRLHESGISQRSLTGDRALRFPEISQFVFDGRRQYSKGRYLGTVFTMVFACDEQPREGILHSERLAYETNQIAAVRDRVSEAIAEKMASRLAETGELNWTRELSVRSGTLHYQPRRVLGWTGSPISLPLTSIRGFDLSEGAFYVWTVDHDRPVLRARAGEPNFYPGLLVFEQLLERSWEGVSVSAPL